MIIDLIANFSLMTMFLFFQNLLITRWKPHSLGEQHAPVLIGALHGICGVLLMFFSVEVSQTTIVDMRLITVISSSYFGGGYASMLTAAIIATGRVCFFGGFNHSSVTAICLAFALALGSGMMMKYASTYWRKWAYSLVLAAVLLCGSLYYLLGKDESLAIIPELTGVIFIGGLFTAALIAYLSASNKALYEVRTREKKYRELNSLQELIFQSASGISIFVTDLEGKISKFNYGSELMLGFTADEAVGLPARSLFDPFELKRRMERYIQEYGEPINLIDVLLFTSQSVDFQDREWTLIHKDGSRLTVALMITPVVADGEIIGYMGTATDVTARKQTEEKLRRANEMLQELSFMDGLTGIPNRRQFDEVLLKEWKRAERGCDGEGSNLSLLMLDIDYFKKYNDTYGHQLGDECLKKAASLLRSTIGRPSDIAARYGGEEFAVILPDTDSAGAFKVAENLRLAMEREAIPHTGSKVSGVVTFSIGAATLYPRKGESLETLIAQADEALYEAKTSGRNCVRFKTAISA